MKVNLGCGALLLDGYLNVDAFHDEADVKQNVFECEFEDLAEVRMDHMLEHIPHVAVPSLLEKIRGWMRPGGKLVVEVPDMEAIMAAPNWLWEIYIYGCQADPGEYHGSGYTPMSLEYKLRTAGFVNVQVTAFVSEHRNRPGMPCLLATAEAPQ